MLEIHFFISLRNLYKTDNTQLMNYATRNETWGWRGVDSYAQTFKHIHALTDKYSSEHFPFYVENPFFNTHNAVLETSKGV